uniref:Uncharacterized protein n=1 Tax=Anguilla anguilla TaxID=7936 RepID=A0A0E9WN16_ANGAN
MTGRASGPLVNRTQLADLRVLIQQLECYRTSDSYHYEEQQHEIAYPKLQIKLNLPPPTKTQLADLHVLIQQLECYRTRDSYHYEERA